MIELNIPGRRNYKLSKLVLDVNGTITSDGLLIDDVPERLLKLSKVLDIFIITADTQGQAKKLADYLGLNLTIITPGNEDRQKLEFVQEAGSSGVIAIGNGSNDGLMLKEAAIGMCVIGKEGAAKEAFENGDVLVTDINTGLDLLLQPKRLIATLRK